MSSLIPAQWRSSQMTRSLSPKPIKSKHMWQSRIEIEYYSVVYFERITEFDVL